MDRAATFTGILGNEAALRLLEKALASGEVSHAYLFYGPPGVGKRTVARRFGAALVAGGDGGAQALRRSTPLFHPPGGHAERSGGKRAIEDAGGAGGGDGLRAARGFPRGRLAHDRLARTGGALQPGPAGDGGEVPG